MKFIFPLLISFGICIVIFFGMHLMIKSDNKKIQENSQTRHLVYLREKKDTVVERKRSKPKEPEKKELPKKIQIKTDLDTKINENIKIKPFKIETKKIDVAAISSLNGAQVEMGQNFFDAHSLQALRKVNPKYPRRAKIKKQEGFIELAFNIDKEGFVSNVTIINSNPKDVFDKSALNAIKKWRFKKSESSKNATITFNYKLIK